MHLRLRKYEKLPQTYRKLADLRLQNTSCSFEESAVAEFSLNLRCPALIIYRRTIDAITICYFNHSTLLIFASKLSVRFGYLFIIV